MKPKFLAALVLISRLTDYEGGWAVGMPQQENASGSEVADSSTILAIEILAVEFSPWKPETDGSGLRSREARLGLRLKEVLKGKVQQAAGQLLEIRVRQRGTGGGRVMDFYGVWSHAPLSRGTALIAFCKGESDDARALLSSENCHELMEEQKVYTDTKAAALLEARKLPPAEVLALAARVAAQYGGVFARLVWELVRAELLRNPQYFDLMMRVVENPDTNPQAREVYLSRAHEELGMTKSPPREQEIRLAQAMLRVIELKGAEQLREAVAEVYLPNLLGLSRSKPKYTAAEVLAGAKFHRAGLADSVARASQEPRAQALAAWLRTER